MHHRHPQRAFAFAMACAVASVFAQTGNVKPPQAQAWIDVATFSGMGMPMGGMGGAGGPGGPGANPMSALGGLFGGGGGGAGARNNSFGQTQTMAAGRWVDVTLLSRNNPSLSEAQQAVPAGFMTPALKLQAPRNAKPPPPDSEEVTEPTVERPKGRLVLYWGCGATVRAGQPKVLEMASASAADIANFFVSRRATQRGTHSAPGRPLWPSPVDPRMVPDGASLVGEHAFSGQGVPEGFRFQIGAAQDLMPPLQVQQSDQAGATELRWGGLPNARAYFAAGMGAVRQDEMVIWTSSELPEIGFGLVDYQTNAAVDRWLREKVLLAPATTQCTVPKGVFPGEGAMLRVIAYGNELNLVHPPRPADPKATWEQLWAVKLRVKSMASLMLGMPSMETMPPAAMGSEKPAEPTEKKPGALDLLKGILGR
jgi:hypothetical protein